MSLARELAPEPEPGPHAVPRRRAGPSRVWVLLLLTHAALLGLMLSRRLDFLFNDAMHRVGPASDFATYYVAGHDWLEGRSIYRGGYGFGYRYHPLFAMTAGAGLCHLPIRAAFALWVVLHELLLLGDLWALRILIPDGLRRRAFAALMLLFSPYYLEVYMGNASFVAASLLLFAFCLDRQRGPVLQASRTADSRRDWALVLLFVASIVVKPVGVVFLPLLLMRGRAAAALGIGAAAAALAVPYFFRHPLDLGLFLTANLEGRAQGWVVHAGNQGLQGLLAAILTRASGISTAELSSLSQLPAATRALLVASQAAVAVLALRASWRARERLGVGVFLGSCIYLLAFGEVWEHSYSILVLGLAFLWASDFVPPRLLLGCSIGLALPTAFALYDVALPPGGNDPEHHWSLLVSVLHHATKPLFLAPLFAACVIGAERIGGRRLPSG